MSTKEIISAIKSGHAWMNGEYIGKLNKSLFGLFVAGVDGVESNGNSQFDYNSEHFFATFGELYVDDKPSISISGRKATMIINALMQ